MKIVCQIVWRLCKVIYFCLILVGFYITYIAFQANAPYTTTSISTVIHCHNGKTFDPSSKPIYPNDGRPTDAYRSYEIGSECEYDTAYFIGESFAMRNNYTEEVKVYTYQFGSIQNQIVNTGIATVSYFLGLELLRRVTLYILFGRNFLTLKTE